MFNVRILFEIYVLYTVYLYIAIKYLINCLRMSSNPTSGIENLPKVFKTTCLFFMACVMFFRFLFKMADFTSTNQISES